MTKLVVLKTVEEFIDRVKRKESVSRYDVSLAFKWTAENSAKLRGSDLRWSNLSWSNLCGSDLSGSNLSGSNLRESKITNTTKFSKIKITRKQTKQIIKQMFEIKK